MDNTTNNTVEASPVSSVSGEATSAQSQAPVGGGSKSFIWITLLALIVICAFGGFWFFGRDKDASNYSVSMNSEMKQDTQETQTKNGIYHYVNKANGFSIDVPSSWKVDQSGQYGGIVSFVSKITNPNDEKKFFINVGVGTEDTQGADLEVYMGDAEKALKQYLTNYKLVSKTDFTVGKDKAYIIEGSFSQGEVKIHNYQLIVVKGGLAYIVTATSLDDYWSRDKETLLPIIKTFSFLN